MSGHGIEFWCGRSDKLPAQCTCSQLDAPADATALAALSRTAG
jgi:hypothetical protein